MTVDVGECVWMQVCMIHVYISSNGISMCLLSMSVYTYTDI